MISRHCPPSLIDVYVTLVRPTVCMRRVVPLALALLNISHPDFAVIDQLSRLTHDADADVAQSAIMVRTVMFVC